MSNQEIENQLRAHAAKHWGGWRFYTLHYELYSAKDLRQQAWFLIRDAQTKEILSGVERGAAAAFRRVEMLVAEPAEIVDGYM